MSKFSRAVGAVAAALLGALIPAAESASANPLAPIWTGAYAGFHGGGSWGSIDFRDFRNTDTSAWTGGGHAGFNLSFGAFVAGVEGDLNYDGSHGGYANGLGGPTGNLDTNWTATLRGRVGVPIGPALLYATAGFAWKDTTFVETDGGGLSASHDSTFTGAVYGIGAEAYVLPNLSVRLEALRFDYGSEKLSLSRAIDSIEEIDPSETVVRAGVTFHLN